MLRIVHIPFVSSGVARGRIVLRQVIHTGPAEKGINYIPHIDSDRGWKMRPLIAALIVFLLLGIGAPCKAICVYDSLLKCEQATSRNGIQTSAMVLRQEHVADAQNQPTAAPQNPAPKAGKKTGHHRHSVRNGLIVVGAVVIMGIALAAAAK